jgi:hypothetical protein
VVACAIATLFLTCLVKMAFMRVSARGTRYRQTTCELLYSLLLPEKEERGEIREGEEE